MPPFWPVSGLNLKYLYKVVQVFFCKFLVVSCLNNLSQNFFVHVCIVFCQPILIFAASPRCIGSVYMLFLLGPCQTFTPTIKSFSKVGRLALLYPPNFYEINPGILIPSLFVIINWKFVVLFIPRRKARAEKPLKCYQHLTISSGNHYHNNLFKT